MWWKVSMKLSHKFLNLFDTCIVQYEKFKSTYSKWEKVSFQEIIFVGVTSRFCRVYQPVLLNYDRIYRIMKRRLSTPVPEPSRKRLKGRKKAAPTPEQIIKCLRAISIPKGSPGYISKVNFDFADDPLTCSKFCWGSILASKWKNWSLCASRRFQPLIRKRYRKLWE